MKSTILAVLLLAWGCGAPQPPTEVAEEPTEIEPVVVTRWTEQTELFMEFPPLRPGERSRFAVHLTDLRSFKPLTEGHVEVVLDYGRDSSEVFVADTPSRPGIFGVDVVPGRQGTPAMTVSVRSHGIEDSHLLGPTSVSGTPGDQAMSAATDGAADGISFLKEQQWVMDFATDVVATASVRESLLVPATIEARSGGRIAVTAPVAGRLLPSARLPVLGESVKDGQELGAIVPLWGGPLDRNALQLAVDQSTVALETARRARQRAERLLEVGAVPERRVQDARSHESLASAQQAAATKQMEYYEASRRDAPHLEANTAFSVRSHLTGVVTAVLVKDGAHVEEGEVLLEVAATDTVHVSGAIPESSSAVLGQLKGAEIQLPGSDATSPVGKLVTAGQLVDPATRTLKATYAVDNRRRQLAIGQSVLLRLFTSAPVEAPTVPTSAVVSQEGLSIVYVQTAGETFEERRVVLGGREGQRVQVLSGVRQGERIVSRGAYLVRLASMSTEAPAHGHVH